MAAIHAEFIGSGYLALRDANLNAYPCGVLQDVSLDMTSDVKELMGSNKVAFLTAEVGRKYKLTAKFAQFNSALVGAVMGGTVASGAKYVGTATKTASTSTFTVVTADFGTPAGWAFVSDLGVSYNATNQPLKYNASTLAAAQYQNTAAAYTLHSTDASAVVNVSCIYSATAGETTSVSNSAIGLSTYFSVYLFQATTQADATVKKIGWYFPAVLLPSLKMDFKNTDFAVQSIDLNVFANSAGLIAEQYTV